jgi:predicted nucleotidyltransferase
MSIIDQYNADIQRLCAKHKVRRLYVFGSILTDNFNKESDIDFIVDFEHIDIGNYADNYFDLKFALEDTLHRPVDLLEEKTIRNPYFKTEIENHRQLIYGH